MVGSSRDHGRDGPHDAALAGTAECGRLQRLHIDGSEHRWFGDERYYELIVVLDDATSEIYYAQLVEAESTRTVMVALREVVETRGLLCSLYSDLPATSSRRRRVGSAWIRAVPHRWGGPCRG